MVGITHECVRCGAEFRDAQSLVNHAEDAHAVAPHVAVLPVPDSWVAPKCAGCGARNWQVDHVDGDPDQPLMCGECAYQHSDSPL